MFARSPLHQSTSATYPLVIMKKGIQEYSYMSKTWSDNAIEELSVLKTVDTDVVTLAISLFNEMGDGLDELWIDFGVGRNRRFYPVHSLYHQLGQDKAKALRFFHSFTGCDQVSFMAHVTKTSALKLWEVFPDVTQHFIVLGNEPSLEDVQESFPVLERFTVLLYDRNSNSLNTNECRRDLFCQGRMIDNIPPTSAALFNHVLKPPTSLVMSGNRVW